MTRIGHRLEAPREGARLAEPVPHPVGEPALEPRRVEPVRVAAQGLRRPHRAQLAFLGAPLGPLPTVSVEALRCRRQAQRTAVEPRRILEKDQPAQPIVGRHAVALPRHDQDARPADALAGTQAQVGLLHAGGDPRRPGRRALQARGPLTRPADGDEEPLAAVLDVEEGEHVV